MNTKIHVLKQIINTLFHKNPHTNLSSPFTTVTAVGCDIFCLCFNIFDDSVTAGDFPFSCSCEHNAYCSVKYIRRALTRVHVVDHSRTIPVGRAGEGKGKGRGKVQYTLFNNLKLNTEINDLD